MNRRVSVGIAGLLSCSPYGFGGGSQPQPNIVFVVVDDLGWSDVQALAEAGGLYETPNIRRMAEQGMVFTDAYSAAPVCSPVRASLITGKSPAALRLTSHIPGNPGENRLRVPEGATVFPAATGDRLPLEEITFAEVLKEEGYRTGYFGKWHLAGEGAVLKPEALGSVAPEYHPDRQGFDINIGGCGYGTPPSYFSPYRNATIPDGAEGEYLTDRLTEEAIRFMETNREGPFLVYLNYYSVHRPHQPRPDLLNVERYGEKAAYASMVACVDENLGRVMEFLSQARLEENTLLLFTSDNGGLEGNAPLRGLKGSLWEGGIRVPLIARRPNMIPPGSICREPVISYDFFPTILNVSGSSRPLPEGVEGECLVPLLMNRGVFHRHRPLYWHFPHFHNDGMTSAIREKNWKLIYSYETRDARLFDLADDPGEQQDLSARFPEKTADLKSLLFSRLEQVNAAMPEGSFR